MHFQAIKEKVESLLGEYRKTCDRVAELQLAKDQACANLTDAEEAQKIVQIIAAGVQQQAHDRIAGIVTRCLASVFDDPYTFKIVFEQKRGKTEARLVFERDGVERDPMTESGGGVVDVAAFALRLSALLLSRPPLRRVLVLDEPFRFVSLKYRDRVRLLMESLSKDLDVQFILVTHDPAYMTGKVIEL